MEEQRIQEIGKSLLEYSSSSFSGLNITNWSQALIDKMMTNESFRVASLRFTDVAPTLRNDEEFMSHLTSYFAEVGNLKGFIGSTIPGSGFLARVVAPLVRRNIKSMAHTFIAGETLDESLHTFKKLHNNNLACSIDLLGEAVISKKEADNFTESYKKAIVEIANATKHWNTPQYPETDRIGKIARANVSIKLSALYEHVNTTAHNHTVEELCKRYRALLDVAMEHNVYIHIDTEQYNLLPVTLDVFETVLMEEKYKKYPHVGIVCQAYLKDSEALLHHLIRFATKRGTPFSIRLVKGAYWDYEQAMAEQKNWPCPVFSIKEDTDANFEKLINILIKAYPKIRPCIGSHNARSLAVAIEAIQRYNLQIADVEFQMLYGMADNFRNALRSMGYRVRQYCPIGEFIPGMSYLVRRLLENTANQSFLKLHNKQKETADTLLKEPKFSKVSPQPYSGFLNHPLKDFSIEEERLNAENAIKKYSFNKPATVTPFINGKKVQVKESIMINCPWQNDKIISEVKLATTQEAELAISSANKAFNNWRDMGAIKRAEILKKAAKIANKRWSELFAAQVYEASKDWNHADADIAEGIDFINYYAEQAPLINKNYQPQSKWGEINKTIYEPRGVITVIAPWNFPFAISAGMTSAALAAGNTVIYKPAEQTSYTGQLLNEIYQEAGIPKGVFNFVSGKGEEIGKFLVEHKDIAGVAFTGSREVGLEIYKNAAIVQKGQNHLKKCVIEMGGKNALIIDSDADLDEAVPATVSSAFAFQGQKCSACSRVIVIGSAYEPFIKRIKDMVESLQVGNPTNPANDINAVIDNEAYQKIHKYIDIGKKDGELLAKANISKLEDGHFITPHVFINLKEGSKLTTDEVFGPVLSIYQADTVEQAVEMAMDSEYALTGGAFSRNPQTLDYIKQHFKVGNLYINRGTTGALVSRQPFGGAALSGTGTKSGGADYLLNFLEARTITENTMRRGFAPKDE